MKIIIVDEYSLVRKALGSLLNSEGDMEVADEASNVVEAIEKICFQLPEVVLLGSRISNRSTIDVIIECRKRNVSTKFLVMSQGVNEHEFRQFLKIGVEGYILMQAMPEELLYGLRLVFRGKRYYDCMVMDILLNEENSIPELTPRELDVLIALGKGMNNKAMAQNLFITEFTVKKHVGQILSKLNLKDRTEAALYANIKGISEYR